MPHVYKWIYYVYGYSYELPLVKDAPTLCIHNLCHLPFTLNMVRTCITEQWSIYCIISNTSTYSKKVSMYGPDLHTLVATGEKVKGSLQGTQGFVKLPTAPTWGSECERLCVTC